MTLSPLFPTIFSQDQSPFFSIWCFFVCGGCSWAQTLFLLISPMGNGHHLLRLYRPIFYRFSFFLFLLIFLTFIIDFCLSSQVWGIYTWERFLFGVEFVCSLVQYMQHPIKVWVAFQQNQINLKIIQRNHPNFVIQTKPSLTNRWMGGDGGYEMPSSDLSLDAVYLNSSIFPIN